MLGRRTRLDTTRAEQEAEPVRRMLKFERKLREQLEKLASQLHETQHELNLTPEHIENVVRVGLELAEQPALIAVEIEGIWPDPTGVRKTCPVFRLPALSNSWAQCANGLAHPHTKKIRPIVFDAALAAGRDDVVLAHLNHRLVQMCLRLLRAEIWSLGTQAKHLSRVSACVVDDSALTHPVVIAHGRIVVLGGDNHRLHEEIITAGGALIEGRFSRLNVGETKAALAAATDIEAPAAIEARFQALWSKHRDALLAAMETRRVERTKNLEKNLDELAEKEVNKLTSVMTELQRAIKAELERKDAPQLLLDLGSDEPGKQQRERDLAALRRSPQGNPGGNPARVRATSVPASPAPVPVSSRSPSPGSSRASQCLRSREASMSPSVSRHHADWLSLVEVSGPFVSLPVLLRVFPQGLEPRDPAQAKALRAAYDEWQDNPTAPGKQRAWVMHVLTTVLGYPQDQIAEGQMLPAGLEANMPEMGETLRPDYALVGPAGSDTAGQAQLIIISYPTEQSLDKPVVGKHWKATPATRMMELLHGAGVPLGLVSNGEHWMLVYAPRGEITGYASWYGALWLDEPITLRAFHSLLGVRRFFGVAADSIIDSTRGRRCH